MEPRDRLAASIGAEEAAVLWPHLTERRLAEGEAMFTEGVSSRQLYFVVEGTLIASVLTDEGPVGLGTVAPGAWVGEIGFIDGGASTATVVAATDVTVYGTTHTDLLQVADTHPRAAAVLIREITTQLANRLASSTAGIVEEIADGMYRLREPHENRGWLSNALERLFGWGNA